MHSVRGSSYDPLVNPCPVCIADQGFLRSVDRPEYESPSSRIRVVDLFCGGGGLSVGVAEAARRVGRGTDIVLAVENDDETADVYALNFPSANLVRSDVCEVFGSDLGGPLTTTERRFRRQIGRVDILVAGPPCQGHSDLNNRTRRDDPRNALYLRVVRAAEVLRPTFVLVENVPAVRHDAGAVVAKATAALEQVGYLVASSVLDLLRFGVPQRRKRHILLATRDSIVEPSVVLDAASPCADHDPRTVSWAIHDLVGASAATGPDSASSTSADNQERIRYLFEEGVFDLPNRLRPNCHHDVHSYTSMYGRLSWEAPAQTITTGFGSMGQGRFVHPGLHRTLTPHEAARLQTLPDFFDLGASKSRHAWANVIGNAVPPLLGVHLIEPLLCAIAVEECACQDDVRGSGATTPNSPLRRKGTPPASSELIRTRMTTTRRRDTAPELALRSALFRLGCRFRVDRTIDGTRRRVDIVFPRDRIAVFVDGCFWHGCSDHGSLPKQNTEWWTEKLESNRQRDHDTDRRLRSNGWEVLRFWEHDNPLECAEIVHDVVLARRASIGGRN